MGRPESPGHWYQKILPFLWYDVFLAIYIGIYAAFAEFTTSAPILNLNQLKKCTGEVAVITGGPAGLALGIIKRLTQLDYTIIMGVRSVEDGKQRLSKFAKLNPELSFDKVQFLPMDLKSLKSVNEFANEVLKKTSRIDLLLCNAAIMGAPYELTNDGYESQFQVNYLGHYLLTKVLLDNIKKTAQTRETSCKIIFTSSIVNSFGRLDFNELETCEVYTPYKFYYTTKLCQVIAMCAFQRQLEKENAKVNCYAVHPGLVPTGMWNQAGGSLVEWFGFAFSRLFRTVENAADTILYPAFSPSFEHRGGLYMESGASVKLCARARDINVQSKLCLKSDELISSRINFNLK